MQPPTPHPDRSWAYAQRHSALLLKYTGIAFISGAVNHGFFSGERSLWTAAVGIVLFVAGAWLGLRERGARNGRALLPALSWGAVLSVGLGFFTGGLQHFPDSPVRSAWVVPVGFALCALAFAREEGLAMTRRAWVYALGAGALVTVASLAAGRMLPDPSDEPHGIAGQTHTEAAVETLASPAKGPVAASVFRRPQSLGVELQGPDACTPGRVEARAGEALQLHLRNRGTQEASWSLEADATVKPAPTPDGPTVVGMAQPVRVAAGGGETVLVTAAGVGTLTMRCRSGNDSASASLVVLPAAAAAAPPAPRKRAVGHDHGSHRH